MTAENKIVHLFIHILYIFRSLVESSMRCTAVNYYIYEGLMHMHGVTYHRFSLLSFLSEEQFSSTITSEFVFKILNHFQLSDGGNTLAYEFLRIGIFRGTNRMGSAAINTP